MVEVPCPKCPRCEETMRVRFTFTSFGGKYCFCESCGKVWHVALTPDGKFVKYTDAHDS